MADTTHPVNWFELPATNLDRAKAFYEHVLGIQLQLQEMGPVKMAWFPMQMGATGATGSLVQAENYQPSTQGTVVYFSVEDIEATLQRISNKGGKMLKPKTSIGEYGFIAHFLDCEGNRAALHATR